MTWSVMQLVTGMASNRIMVWGSAHVENHVVVTSELAGREVEGPTFVRLF